MRGICYNQEEIRIGNDTERFLKVRTFQLHQCHLLEYINPLKLLTILLLTL